MALKSRGWDDFNSQWNEMWAKKSESQRVAYEKQRFAMSKPDWFDEPDEQGNTLLHWAARVWDEKAIARLRERKNNPNSKNKMGMGRSTRLWPRSEKSEPQAGDKGKRKAAVMELLAFKEYLEMDGCAQLKRGPLALAQITEDAQIIRALLERGADPLAAAEWKMRRIRTDKKQGNWISSGAEEGSREVFSILKRAREEALSEKGFLKKRKEPLAGKRLKRV